VYGVLLTIATTPAGLTAKGLLVSSIEVQGASNHSLFPPHRRPKQNRPHSYPARHLALFRWNDEQFLLHCVYWHSGQHP
jgi:5-deoxy-D-glucuronate isomerase